MKLTKNFRLLLLGIWLILTGLMPVLHINFEGMGIAMAVLAIAAGVLCILE